MSVLKALSTHLSSTQQTAFHLEVGCKSNHTHRPHKARSLTRSLKASLSLFTQEKFKEDCKSEEVCPLVCVHIQSGVCVCGNWGQDRRKRLDSGGVGTAEVPSPVLSVGLRLISPSVHSVFSSLCSALHTHTHTKTKHFTIRTGYTTVRINRMHTSALSAYTWLTHTSVAAARKTDPAICSAQSFPELSKPEPALNSQV